MRCGVPKRSISRTWTAQHGIAAFGYTEASPHVFSILLGQQPSTLSLDYLRAFAGSSQGVRRRDGQFARSDRREYFLASSIDARLHYELSKLFPPQQLLK